MHGDFRASLSRSEAERSKRACAVEQLKFCAEQKKTLMKTKDFTKKRILTGDNTTGRLHIGHYVGRLENRVKLQDEYETIIVLADLHALAYPKYVASPDIVSDSIFQVAVDNLAVGIGPNKSYIFPDSTVPEISEIA